MCEHRPAFILFRMLVSPQVGQHKLSPAAKSLGCFEENCSYAAEAKARLRTPTPHQHSLHPSAKLLKESSPVHTTRPVISTSITDPASSVGLVRSCPTLAEKTTSAIRTGGRLFVFVSPFAPITSIQEHSVTLNKKKVGSQSCLMALNNFRHEAII